MAPNPNAPVPSQSDDEFVVSAGPQYEPAPAGPAAAVCCDLINKGMVKSSYEGREDRLVPKIRILFQIDEKDATGKRFVVGRTFTKSLDVKSNLRKFVNGWRGRDLTEDEAKALDLTKLLGAPALIQVVHTKREDKVYADIDSIMRVPKGMDKLTVEDYIRFKNRPPKDATAPAGAPGTRSSGTGPGKPGVQHPEPSFEDFPGALEDEDDDLPF